jgi:hypothetical protein
MGVHTTRKATSANEVAPASQGGRYIWRSSTWISTVCRLTLLGATLVGGMHLPVIGLTRRGDLKTKLVALEAGVDDMMTVPFAHEELLARVIALVRRANSDAVMFTPVIKLGELEIDIPNRTVRAGTSDLHLTQWSKACYIFLRQTLGAWLPARRSWTRCGAWTMSPRATSWTARFAICGRDSRTTGGSRASSPRCRDVAIGSC